MVTTTRTRITMGMRTRIEPATGEAGEQEIAWLARLLQSSDSMFPTGAYAHSFGLEGLVEAGAVRNADDLRLFIEAEALPALARTDLPVAAITWRAADEPPDWDRIEELCRLGASLRGARELRAACEAIGSQRVALAARLHGGIAREFDRRAQDGNWPKPSSVAAAIEARATGTPCEAMLTAMIYSTTAGLVSASVKLLRLGQNACQSLVTSALASAPPLAAAAMALPDEEIGSFNPWWDIAASRHETADCRLFIS